METLRQDSALPLLLLDTQDDTQQRERKEMKHFLFVFLWLIKWTFDLKVSWVG